MMTSSQPGLSPRPLSPRPLLVYHWCQALYGLAIVSFQDISRSILTPQPCRDACQDTSQNVLQMCLCNSNQESLSSAGNPTARYTTPPLRSNPRSTQDRQKRGRPSWVYRVSVSACRARRSHGQGTRNQRPKATVIIRPFIILILFIAVSLFQPQETLPPRLLAI